MTDSEANDALDYWVPAQPQPEGQPEARDLTDDEILRCIDAEFPRSLARGVVIEKMYSVCLAVLAAQPKDEPIATIHDDGYWTHKPGRDPLDRFSGRARLDVYEHPAPQPKPQPDAVALTDERLDAIYLEVVGPRGGKLSRAYARAVLAAHAAKGKP